MKFLHTSDWHLGRSLYGRKRYDEFSAFLEWLTQTIETENIDALLIAGDIFDTGSPSNRAQELYYRFLGRIASSSCRHIVIISGNHDSPSFLNAPKALLQSLNVYVSAIISDNPADEVIVLYDRENLPEAIICAVPYLRDKDIRTVTPGESIDDKNDKLIEGIKNHYAAVCSVAEEKQKELKRAGHTFVPIIAMGHLFTASGKTADGDGVRELYVGSLAHVGAQIFPASIDYLALGHLHVPQRVGAMKHMRYSGSPIPMGYGEARQVKKIFCVTCEPSQIDIQEIIVPCFQALERITGTLEEILARIEQLKKDQSNAWLEIEYTGNAIVNNLREKMDTAISETSLEILRIKNKRLLDRVIDTQRTNETLDDLNEQDVFKRCLAAFNIPPEEQAELTASYQEILTGLHEDDTHAE